MSDPDTPQSVIPSVWANRVIMYGLQTCFAVLLAWYVPAFLDMTKSVGVLADRIDTLARQVDKLDDKVARSLNAADAREIHKNIHQQLTALDVRVRDVELSR